MATSSLVRQVGLITAEPTPTLLSVVAYRNLDFVVLDAEQTTLTLQQCADAVQRLSGAHTRVAVRVPDLDDMTLVAFANTGVDEIVLPKVRHPKELERAHRATRFGPPGSRPKQASFASAFGADYSLEPRLTVLFETVEAVDAVEDFVALEHFDGGWVGPTDLAGELLKQGRPGAVALEESVQRVVDVLGAAGQSVGLPAADIARAGDVHARGADRAAVYWERELASMIAQLAAAAAPETHWKRCDSP
ncbi:aldolase/citrate lyase family protein [Arthrobacter sp. efr-133-TYG-118]|jgi:2-keto-3-deoxy-L-rhamnonate aldolase RhmA|uniref:aldolase/citrate lyase family protein n=1 Tax=Arthrobacter sp. efr-133-TYG-118 TaxID=3040279 RepID=UPI00254C9297|nr:aldolase/citrate lyase family protein [Arthrobacter sp. efr-133-TYG-118]